MILTITGPSASGKTTLMRGIVAARQDARPLESVTTRSPRETDMPGEYRYITSEMFDAFLREGGFLWDVEAHGNRYGTRRQSVDDALTSGMHIALLTIGGVRPLLEYATLAGKKEAVRSVYLRVGDDEKLRERLVQRGDSEEDIARRIEECKPWDREAQTAGVRFRVIESTLPKETVLAQALQFLDEPQKKQRPSLQ